MDTDNSEPSSRRLGRNMVWHVSGSVGSQIVAPLFSVFAARFLMPSDYGVYGIAMAVMTLVELVKNLGMEDAIIVDEQSDDHLSFLFTQQLIFGSLGYAALFVMAPLVARAYDMPEFTSVSRILNVAFFLSVFELPILTECRKSRQYRLVGIRGVLGSVTTGIVSVAMAMANAGVYALVLGSLAGKVVMTVFMVITSPRRPSLYWSGELFRRLLMTGKHVVSQHFCAYLVLYADTLIVGQALGASVLGIYRMGKQLTLLVPGGLLVPAKEVMFTEFAAHRDDHEYIRTKYHRFIFASYLLCSAISAAIFFSSPFFIPLFLGTQWRDLVRVVQIVSIVVPSLPICFLNADIAKIYGFNHVYTRFALIRALVTVAAVLAASFFSLNAVLLSWSIMGLLGPLANAACFFASQKVIRPGRLLAVCFAANWCWACYVLMHLTE